MKTTKKSFASPSNKPCDVEYRLKRLRGCLSDAHMFLTSIDPSVFPVEHRDLLEAIGEACHVANSVSAPTKKARKSEAEKARAAEEAALKKAARKTAREQFRAHQKAEKAASKAQLATRCNPEGEVAVKSEPQAASPVATTAIERALAAAKARKAQRQAQGAV